MIYVTYEVPDNSSTFSTRLSMSYSHSSNSSGPLLSYDLVTSKGDWNIVRTAFYSSKCCTVISV